MAETDPVPTDDLTDDLMRRVSAAIEEWTAAHGLENMPKDVLLTQVTSILGAITDNLAESRVVPGD